MELDFWYRWANFISVSAIEIVGVVFWKGFAYIARFLTVLEGNLTAGLSTIAKVYRNFGIRLVYKLDMHYVVLREKIFY